MDFEGLAGPFVQSLIYFLIFGHESTEFKHVYDSVVLVLVDCALCCVTQMVILFIILQLCLSAGQLCSLRPSDKWSTKGHQSLSGYLHMARQVDELLVFVVDKSCQR